MGKIVKPLRVEGDQGASRITCLLDSGAGASLVRRDVAEALCRNFFTRRTPRVFHMANGDAGLQTDRTCLLALDMKGKDLTGQFYVVEKLVREILVGVDFMQAWEIKLDMKAEDYTVGVDPEAIEIARIG